MPRSLLTAVALAIGTLLLVAACGGSSESTGSGDGAKKSKLTLVAYSTPREVYEELIPKFQATDDGKGVKFEQSYGASGEQSRAVEAGLGADVVAFSLAPDVDRLVDAGLVADNWADDEFDGMVSRSVVALAVRKGNPKHIEGWDDLVRDDVDVITPNPFTSGGARWNVMAAYGAQLEQGRSKEEALDYLGKLFHNVSVQDKSARESLQTFLGGKGDVLIAYENEAITAQQKGEDIDYVVPAETILIENPIAVTTDGGPTAEAFVDFARSEEAQKVFGEKGYRSIRDDLVDEKTYPTPSSLFTIAKLGGWPDVQERFFDRESGLMADIQREVGAPLDD
jgi:sulfate/thiosulfate transport system substrate-binding protein